VPTHGGVVLRVAVEAVADRPERTFSYRAPNGEVAPGSLVLVPYGRRTALGYVLPAANEPWPDGNLGELRDVEGVVSGPMLTPDLLALAEEVAAYYRAPIGTTLAAMLPPGLESRLERRWTITDLGAIPPAAAARLGDRLAAGDEVADDDVRHALGDVRAMRRLQRAGWLRPAWRLRPPEVAARRVRVLRRIAGEAQPRAGAPVQRALLAALGDGERSLPDLAAELGVEPGAVLEPARRLAAMGAAELAWRDVVRDPLSHRPRSTDPRPLPSAEQQAAVQRIATLPAGGSLLLEGVAATGKTEVYLAAVEATLAGGRGAIVLVPEVALIPQLTDRLAAAFGDEVAVLHSGLSVGERHDTWWRILRGQARVVIGTRMAVMAPLAELGLIVIDESHAGGFKSDRTPRFDARWVADRRAALTGARLVLGTATPSVVDLARVRGEMLERARLTQRQVGVRPSVEIVDLRAELAAGNRSVLSRALATGLEELRAGQEQAILLINRRGAASFVLCRDCGASLRCPDCELPYVYHSAGELLRCHHCGRRASVASRCPTCGSHRIRYFGAGTQRVEAEVRAQVPHLRVARLDSDALATRRSFEAIYDAFRRGEVDVLVGTQLAAKGLDVPAVTLVGVVAADVTLNLPDYLAAERTFQLLAQVAGRAGRGDGGGRVIFQTYAPDHYAVRAAAQLDVDQFAAAELPRRRALGYPPFSVLARLLVSDPRRDRAEERARDAAQAVATPGVEVLGPLPAYLPRRAGRWRFQVVLRAADPRARARALEAVPGGVAIDVDPESLL